MSGNYIFTTEIEKLILYSNFFEGKIYYVYKLGASLNNNF